MNQEQTQQFIKKLSESQESQEAVLAELKNEIVAILSQREKRWVKYWGLCEELKKNLMVPERLQKKFSDDYEKAISELDRDKIVLKSWTSGDGGIVTYPYEAGFTAMIAGARAVESLHRLSMKVQYGDDIKP